MRVLNVRLLVILLVGGLIGLAVVYGLHRYQVRRNAYVFQLEAQRAQQRAEEAHRQGDFAKELEERTDAVRKMKWYVNLRPDDTDALEEFGRQVFELGQYADALDIWERVLRRDPSRSDLRREVAETALRIGRFDDARDHLENHLLPRSPDDAELLELLARCQIAGGEDLQAVASLTRAIEKDPKQFEAYSRLAGVLRHRLDRPEEADQWMEKLVETHPEAYEAHLLYGTYLQGVERMDEAMTHAAKALELKPEDVEVLWLAARTALGLKRYDDARRYASKGIEQNPTNVALYTTLADIEINAEGKEAAIDVLRRGLQATNDHPQLLWSAANLLIDTQQIDGARAMIAKLDEADYSDALVDYLRARLEFAEENWLAALRGFEQVRGLLTAWPTLLKKTDLWLGKCYGESGSVDEQLNAYRRALDIDEFFLPARAGIAEALLASGRLEEARAEYGQLLKLTKSPPAGLIPMARIIILQNLQAPAERRDWRQAAELLDLAEQQGAKSTEIPTLRAEMLLAQGDMAAAEQTLRDARKIHPQSAALWAASATLAQKQQDWQRASAILDEARQEVGDQPELRLARGRQWLLQQGAEAADRLHPLAEDIDAFTADQQLVLLQGLYRLAVQSGDTQQAKTLVQRMVERAPDNVRVQFLAFESAMRRKDEARMRKRLEEIYRLSGRSALWLYGQAVRLSLQAQGADDARLSEALEYLAEASTTRESWAKIPFLAATICDKQNRPEAALENYLEAIAKGERTTGLIQRAVQLLFQQRRYNEVSNLIQQLDQVPKELLVIDSETALRTGNLERALRSAREAAAEADGYREQLWLGQVCRALRSRAEQTGDQAEAEQHASEAQRAFQRAAELSPELPAPWISLVQLFHQTGQADKAEQAIEQARAKIAPDEAALAVAQCYDLMDRREEAEAQYRKALADAPPDQGVVRHLSVFYLRTGQLEEAETLLEQILAEKLPASAEEVAWARRRLALIHASKGGYPNVQKALALVRKNLADQRLATAEDRRMLASLSALLPGGSGRVQAIETLEKMVEGQPDASPQDRFALARLYLAEGAWVKANAQFRNLLASHGDQPGYVEAYVRALIDHQEFDGAQQWLDQLDKLVPDSFTAVQLRAILAFQRDRHDQAVRLLSAYRDRAQLPPKRKAELDYATARLLEQFAQKSKASDEPAAAEQYMAEAERLYQLHTGGRPEDQLRRATFLIRQDRLDEALDLIESLPEAFNPTAVAKMCATLLRNDTITESQVRRAEAALEKAVNASGRSSGLLQAVAVLRAFQQRYAEAEALYREALRENPKNYVAMNNLAVLLALEKTKLDEALALMDRAIKIAGPMPVLLDSRATVYIARGESRKAIDDLQKAVGLDEGVAPVRYFHLAQAYHQAGDKPAATAAFEKAQQLGLEAKMLEPQERPVYEKLRKSL